MKIIPLLVLIFLYGCSSQYYFSCSGWQKPPKVNDSLRMVQIEPALTRWIVATDSFGQKQQCWK